MTGASELKDKTYRGVTVPWRYLVASHGEETLRDWVRRLRYFRFCRAVVGGHAADGDSLVLALKDRDRTGDVNAALAGLPASVGYGDAVLRISLQGGDGDAYAVTETDVRNAEAVERELGLNVDDVVDPPVDSTYCVAPKFWPEFWEA